MRNIATVNTKNTPYKKGIFIECKCDNSLFLEIVIDELVNPYLEITLQDDSIINTNVLETNNGLIEYEIPVEYVYSVGTLKIKILDENGYESDYIIFNILDSLTIIDELSVKIDDEENYLIERTTSVNTNCPYDVGDLYITTNKNNPSKKWSGTSWKLVGQGKTLVGAGTGVDINGVEKTFKIGDTFGEYEHTLAGVTSAGNDEEGIAFSNNNTSSISSNAVYNNMQPGFVVYFWQRIAKRLSINNETLIYLNDEDNPDFIVENETLIALNNEIVKVREGVMTFE